MANANCFRLLSFVRGSWAIYFVGYVVPHSMIIIGQVIIQFFYFIMHTSILFLFILSIVFFLIINKTFISICAFNIGQISFSWPVFIESWKWIEYINYDY